MSTYDGTESTTCSRCHDRACHPNLNGICFPCQQEVESAITPCDCYGTSSHYDDCASRLPSPDSTPVRPSEALTTRAPVTTSQTDSGVDQLRQRLTVPPALAEALIDTIQRMTVYGETEDGDVACYLVSKGTVHRLVGQALSAGVDVWMRRWTQTRMPMLEDLDPAPSSEELNAISERRRAMFRLATDAGAQYLLDFVPTPDEPTPPNFRVWGAITDALASWVTVELRRERDKTASQIAEWIAARKSEFCSQTETNRVTLHYQYGLDSAYQDSLAICEFVRALKEEQ